MERLSQFGIMIMFVGIWTAAFLLAIVFLLMAFVAPSIPENIFYFLFFMVFAGATLGWLSIVIDSIKDFIKR